MEDRFKERFDGAIAWSTLTPEQQQAIGGAALEVVVLWNGMDAYESYAKTRPFQEGDSLLLDHLHTMVNEAIPEVIEAEFIPVPSLIGPVCRRCGCTQENACEDDNAFGACAWVEENLCSACAAQTVQVEGAHGMPPIKDVVACPACNGAGERRGPEQGMSFFTCAYCDGSGEVTEAEAADWPLEP